MPTTKPEVFIIESLTIEDEEAGRQEGELISRMLHIAGKLNTKYFYIRTRRELEAMINIFDTSWSRYLHISCHADRTGMATTFDDIPYAELGKMLEPCLDGRRVFVSACEMANEKLASWLLKDTGCYSLIGPERAIRFDDAAAFWISFYHLMFKANERAMKRQDLERCITKLAAIYGEPISYFSASASAKQGFKKIRSDHRLDSRYARNSPDGNVPQRNRGQDIGNLFTDGA